MFSKDWICGRTGRTLVFVMVILGLVFGGYTLRRKILNWAAPVIITGFHHVYYNSAVANRDTRWMGVPVQKTPTDLWILQEIIYQTKPDVIVEAGSYLGGSALYFASLFDLIGHGRVVTIDIRKYNTPTHPRIQYLIGSSVDPDIVEQVASGISPSEKVMVVLDSNHTKEHVLKELRLYGPLVSKGCFLIVEDSILNGTIAYRWGEGPLDAIEAFLDEKSDFEVDSSKEKFLLTFNPSGYLRKIK